MKFILGKKLEMSQIFDENKNVIPVTLIEAGPCFVTQIKKEGDKDKYEAVQIGFEKLKDPEGKPSASYGAGKKITKSKRTKPYRYLREFSEQKIINKKQKTEEKELKAGDKIDVSVFEEGDEVKISGISKGRGFAGMIKRHGARRKPASHGNKHQERALGSVGPSFPERVIKGRKMPGRMGAERVSVKNLKIVKIDKENNLLAVKGAVPGRRGTLLEIRG